MLNNHKQFCSNWLVLNNRIFLLVSKAFKQDMDMGALSPGACVWLILGLDENDLDTSMGVSEDSVQCNPKLTD